MAVDIIVRRGAGDRPGEDIIDGLIATVSVALQKGRNELDRQATVKVPARYNTVFRGGRRLGDFIEVEDSLEGQFIRGKVIDIRTTVTETSAKTDLIIEKVSDFDQ